jgi:hypothetical protein
MAHGDFTAILTVSLYRDCGNCQAFKETFVHRAQVAHACNPSYSGGRDQEDRGSKPALGK